MDSRFPCKRKQMLDRTMATQFPICLRSVLGASAQITIQLSHCTITITDSASTQTTRQQKKRPKQTRPMSYEPFSPMWRDIQSYWMTPRQSFESCENWASQSIHTRDRSGS